MADIVGQNGPVMNGVCMCLCTHAKDRICSSNSRQFIKCREDNKQSAHNTSEKAKVHGRLGKEKESLYHC